MNASRTFKDIGKVVGAYLEQKRIINFQEAVALEEQTIPVTLRFLHLPEDTPAQQQELMVDAFRAATVVDVVLMRRAGEQQMQESYKWWKLFRQAFKAKSLEQRTQDLRGLYLRELKDIVDEGMASEAGALYAQRRLNVFKETFVAREADTVKNSHVKRLGLWAAGIATPIVVAAAFLEHRIWFATDQLWRDHGIILTRNFLLLSAAACGGTWLSFSVRKVVLGFEDLAVLEDDRLNPAGRLAFVILLTSVLALLLQTKLVAVAVGTTVVDIGAGGTMAILLGALCGIAERSLSGVVAGRAEEIVGSARRGAAKGEVTT